MKEKALIVVSIALAALVGILGYNALRQHEALAKANAYSEAKDQEIKVAQARLDARNAAFLNTIKMYEQEVESIKSAPQAVKIVTKYVPKTAGQILTVTREDLPPVIHAQLPDAPSYTVFTEQAIVENGKRLAECAKDKAALGKCLDDDKDLRTQLRLALDDRDNWKNTANGGSWAQRSVGALKVGGCAAAGAGIGAGAGKSVKNAAIGALIGSVSCSLIKW
jgi:hypothetical protein